MRNSTLFFRLSRSLIGNFFAELVINSKCLFASQINFFEDLFSRFAPIYVSKEKRSIVSTVDDTASFLLKTAFFSKKEKNARIKFFPTNTIVWEYLVRNLWKIKNPDARIGVTKPKNPHEASCKGCSACVLTLDNFMLSSCGFFYNGFFSQRRNFA